jgi:hypothetical protein
MITKSVEGKEVRYWDVTVGDNGEPKGFVKNPVEVTLQIPETLDEALAVASNDQNRLMALIAKGLEAEAEDKAGSTPSGTFSVPMIAAIDKALKVSPQFAGIKSSKDRRSAIMTWVSKTPGLSSAYLTAFEPLRNAKAEADNDSD